MFSVATYDFLLLMENLTFRSVHTYGYSLKKAAYPEYRKARNEMQELVRAQKNVERFFAEEKPAQENEQAR